MSNGKGDFAKAHKLSAGNEGGISKDTNDTGNYLEIKGNKELSKVFVATRYGQTFGNWLSANGKSTPKNKTEFDNLADEFGKEDEKSVKASFKKQYWDKYNLDDIADADVASNIYDAMINQTYTLGGGGEQKTLANVLTELGYDVDKDTSFTTNKIAITAINKAIEEKGAKAVNTAYSNQREQSYMGSGTVDEHGKGWLKRLNAYREDEDQYSKTELDGMVFTNDSTSNIAVLTELRTANDAKVAGVSATFDKQEEEEEATIEQPTTEEDDDPYSDENINAAVDKFVDWANSDNPEQAILDAVDKVNNEADKKKLQKAAENAIEQKKRAEEGNSEVTRLNKDNSEHLEVHDLSTAGVLEQSDTELIEQFAEEQRIQWTKLGTPSLADTILNASGIQKNKLGVDDDFSNAIMREEIITAMSEGLDMNTNEGKRKLRDRLEAYTVHVKSDKFQGKVADLNTGRRETSFQNMTEDLSFHSKILINDANTKFNLTGSKSIKPTGAVSANIDVQGVIEDNKRILSELAKTDKKLNTEIAKNGMDAVATKLAIAQKEAAANGETDVDPATLLKLSDWNEDKDVRDKSLSEGVSRIEAINFEDVDEDEEEITTTFDVWKKDNPDGTLEQWRAAEDKLNQDKLDAAKAEKKEGQMRKAEMALTGLKAAAGILSLSQALKSPDVETPELDPLIYEALSKQKALSESGLTAKEKGAAMQNMNDAYAGAMKNVLRASGGQRGMYLANQGTVDAQRIQGLNQLAAQDAALHRENIKEYNALATSVGSMKLNRDMNVEQMRQATLNNNRQILSGVGSNLLSDAISDVSYYMNPNRKATEDLIKNLSGKNNNNSGYENPLLNQGITTANITPEQQAAIDKEAAANAKKTDG